MVGTGSSLLNFANPVSNFANGILDKAYSLTTHAVQLYSAVKWNREQVRLRELHLPGDESRKLVAVDINSHYAGAVGPLQLGEL